MSVNVTIAKDDDASNWSNFIEGCSPDNHSYSWHWKDIIQSSFKHKAYYFICKKDTEISAVCPLFFVNSPLFGRALISVPYLNGGGILATDNESYSTLLEEIKKLSIELNCKYVELRHRKPIDETLSKELVLRTHKVAMKLELMDNPEKLFSSFSAKLRSQIRRPQKAGLIAKTSGVDIELKESVDAFYKVFSKHMRDMGTPVYPKALFKETANKFSETSRIITVWDKNRPVACGLTVGSGETVEIPWASSLRSHNKVSANMLLYWRVIEQASLDGYKYFDFGRSTPNEGTYNFKKQWGAEPLQLNWYYALNSGEAPEVNPKSKKFALLVNTWKKLPLPISNLFGPVVTRWLP